MSRLVPAAAQLLSQVQAMRPDAEAEQGDPDGFNRVRSITFDKTTSKWLEPIMRAVTDPRIHHTSYTGPKKDLRLTVTFVPDVRADRTQPFPIEEADAVLNE